MVYIRKTRRNFESPCKGEFFMSWVRPWLSNAFDDLWVRTRIAKRATAASFHGIHCLLDLPRCFRLLAEIAVALAAFRIHLPGHQVRSKNVWKAACHAIPIDHIKWSGCVHAVRLVWGEFRRNPRMPAGSRGPGNAAFKQRERFVPAPRPPDLHRPPPLYRPA